MGELLFLQFELVIESHKEANVTVLLDYVRNGCGHFHTGLCRFAVNIRRSSLLPSFYLRFVGFHQGEQQVTTRMNMKMTDLTDAATLLKESASDQQNLSDTVTTTSSKSVETGKVVATYWLAFQG